MLCFYSVRCRMLNLQRNRLVCLRQLPKLPAIEHLCLSENAISSLGGLGTLGNSPLHSLNLIHNPVTFTQDYRARWGLEESASLQRKRNGKLRETEVETRLLKSNSPFLLSFLCRVFQCLPKLEILDGIPKLPEDCLPTRLHFPESTRMCNIL